MRNLLLALVCAATFNLTGALAQTTVPVPLPNRIDPTPLPFDYPSGFSGAAFEEKAPIADALYLGEFPIELGQTRLSEVARKLDAELHHLPDRRIFLCVSAALTLPEVKKNADEATAVDQNIWLLMGPNGRINEARILLVGPGQEICPKVPDEFSPVSLGPFYAAMSAKALQSASIDAPTAEDGAWQYWFNLDQRQRATLFGLEKNEIGNVSKLIGVVIELKKAP